MFTPQIQPYGANPALMNMTSMTMFGMSSGDPTTTFTFTGNSIGLQSRLQSLTPQETSKYKQAHIMVSGQAVTEKNLLCIYCTTIWGAFLIFPLFFMCCDWWKKIAYGVQNIPQPTYQALSNLFRAPNLQIVNFTIVDNCFNANKCKTLYNILSQTRLKGFTLINAAPHFDVENDQYSNFQQHLRPIKSLPITSQMRWGTKFI